MFSWLDGRRKYINIDYDQYKKWTEMLKKSKFSSVGVILEKVLSEGLPGSLLVLIFFLNQNVMMLVISWLGRTSF